jgi:hypothetical protein
MKLALIGASGFVGKAVLTEALQRGFEVKAIVRNPEKINVQHRDLTSVKADVLHENDIFSAVKDYDVVISAYNPGWTNPDIYNEFLRGANAIQREVKDAGVKRLIVVGGAGSLYVSPGKQLVDTPQFPAEYKPGALAARDYLEDLKKENNLDWTFLSPAIEMHPGTSGTRKGIYRTGSENPVIDEKGRSVISVEDLAVALIDEAENPKHIRQRYTVAY